MGNPRAKKPAKAEKQKEITDIEVAKKMINIHQSAMDRKIEFNLSFDYVKRMLEYKNCFYTGIAFTEEGLNARSFDRVDSDKGYIEGNVVACTIDINGKKSNLSIDEITCLYNKLVKPKPKPKPTIDEDHQLDMVMNEIVKDLDFPLLNEEPKND
jgi:hypothetical protein